MKKLHKEKYRLETTRKTRVKLHKSGKNWVRTIMTQFGFVRLKGTDIKSPIKVKQSYLDAGRLLRGVISAGALVGGVHVLDETALAEEANVVMASEVTNQTTLATTDTVVLSTSEVIVDTSRLSSFLTLLQDSLSHEIKVGYGETYDQYQLAREDAKQLVTEAQELLQVGASNQEIVDTLTIKLEESFHVLDKLTEELLVESSQSESLSLSASVSLSESMAESDSVSLSEAISHSEVTSVSETVSQSETVSESEVLVDTTEIAVDISKLVAVQTSLEDALSKQVADTVDTNSSKYQKYLTAKAGSRYGRYEL
ncbi:KxYKxGKxW signal peptide domain-containing protein [Streptococcus suis]